MSDCDKIKIKIDECFPNKRDKVTDNEDQFVANPSTSYLRPTFLISVNELKKKQT